MDNVKDGSKTLQALTIEKKIMDAFITLYADKPIQKISIKMITDLLD
ncbi:hypothetical protein SH2C18_50200 [Clostridium sediminicola]